MASLSRILKAVALLAALTLTMHAPGQPPSTSEGDNGFVIDQRVLDAVSDYGPLAVLVLLVMPLMGEDIIIIPAGFLICQGHLPWWSTFVCAWVGAMISDGMWYFICYRFGTPLLHKKWFKRLAHPRRLLQAKHQIEQRGAWLIVTARFVPGSRTSTMIVAGLMHMAPWKYLSINGSLLLLTVAMQLGFGWLVAHHIFPSARGLPLIMALVGMILLLLIAAFALNWWLSHRHTQERAPRSKVTWLKRFRSPRPRARNVDAQSLEQSDATPGH
jgi:membrane protein DedA with SNARE-associated domain